MKLDGIFLSHDLKNVILNFSIYTSVKYCLALLVQSGRHTVYVHKTVFIFVIRYLGKIY